MSDIKCALLKPFGSTILKSELPDDLIKEFSDDLNTIRSSPEKIEGHKFGHKLAGNLYKELLVSHPVMLKWKQKYFDTLIVHYATSHYKQKKLSKLLLQLLGITYKSQGISTHAIPIHIFRIDIYPQTFQL